jgi:hypothetical protein
MAGDVRIVTTDGPVNTPGVPEMTGLHQTKKTDILFIWMMP